jgi:ribonuclease D
MSAPFTGIFPSRSIICFDTQLASMFLGEQETSLGAVVNRRFGIQLDKRFQKKDWSQRPLPDGMIEYAASDVST